jgi:hypothetical protein
MDANMRAVNNQGKILMNRRLISGAWRYETYTGMPATDITYRAFLDFLQDAHLRHALRRYVRWLAHMSKLPRF